MGIVEFPNGMENKGALSMSDQVMVAGRDGGAPTLATIQQFKNLLVAIATGQVIPDVARPGDILGTPEGAAVVYAGPGSYTLPTGPVTLTANLNMFIWDGAVWDYIEIPVDVDLSKVELSIQQLNQVIFGTQTESVGISDFSAPGLFPASKVWLNRTIRSNINGSAVKLRSRFGSDNTGANRSGPVKLIHFRRSGDNYLEIGNYNLTSVNTSLVQDIDLSGLGINVQIGDYYGILTADNNRIPLLSNAAYNYLEATINPTTGKYSVPASTLDFLGNGTAGACFVVIVTNSTNELEKLKTGQESINTTLSKAAIPSDKHEFTGVTIPEVRYIPTNGEPEIRGSNAFASNTFGVSYYAKVSNDTLFNKVDIAIVQTTASPTTVRIYKSASLTNLIGNMTLLKEVNYAAGAFNSDINKNSEIFLDENVFVKANEYVYIFVWGNHSILTIRYFNTAGVPARSGFVWKNADTFNPWSEGWVFSNAVSYFQAGIKLTLVDSNALEIKRRVEVIEKSGIIKLDPNILIPSKIYAVVGLPLTIYYDAIMLAVERGITGFGGYFVAVECLVGVGNLDFWRLTPVSSQVGTYILKVVVYDAGKNVVSEATATLIVKAATPLTEKNVLLLGDSTVAQTRTGSAILEKWASISGVIPTLIGTQGAGASKHEGRGGWKFSDFAGPGPVWYKFNVTNVSVLPGANAEYTNNGARWRIMETNVTNGSGYMRFLRIATSNAPSPSGVLSKATPEIAGDATINFTDVSLDTSNPLWNPNTGALDINYYKQTILGLPSTSKIDLVDMQLGINDIGQNPTSILTDEAVTAIINNAKTVLNAFLVDPVTKIVLNLSPTGNNTGGGWVSTNAFQLYMINAFKLRKAILKAFDNALFNSRVYVGFSGAYIHRYYGYPLGQVQISSRYSGISIPIHTNNVHPTGDGYAEIGDGKVHQIYSLL